MMTETLIKCPSCGFKKALTHYSSDNMVNWVACPKERKFFDHDKEIKYPFKDEKSFWKNVEHDTGFKRKD